MRNNPKAYYEEMLAYKQPEQLIRIDQMTKYLGVHRSTLHRWVVDKRFPKPIKIYNKTLGWSESTYKKWLEQNRGNA